MTLEDIELIRKIAERGEKLYRRHDIDSVSANLLNAQISIVHETVTPLLLADLLAANDENFSHDIAGIHDNLIIREGKAHLHVFMPRFAVPQ